MIEFKQLNTNWNAEPNAPLPKVIIKDNNLILAFELNSFMFDEIKEGDRGELIFKNCSKYRLGTVNDHSFYSGNCRFSKHCPQWGEFYEISGDDHLIDSPKDWVILKDNKNRKHFLFYFRDEEFECEADDWEYKHIKTTVLTEKQKKKCNRTTIQNICLVLEIALQREFHGASELMNKSRNKCVDAEKPAG
ncbi:MAG: hypothetical protein ACD_76C00138G0003, partial [uncultured bacterium]